MSVVLAAARMKSHQLDLRQYFPNIDNIAQLDSLRDIPLALCGKFIEDGADETMSPFFSPIDVLSHCRRFHPSAPRDKIFAIAGLVLGVMHPVGPQYEAAVEDVYTELAVTVYKCNELEFLRLCGSPFLEIASWVPDWSIEPESTSLPARKSFQYADVPWWAEASDEYEKHDISIGLIQKGTYPSLSEDYIAAPYTLLGYHFRGYPKVRQDADLEKCMRRESLRLSTMGEIIDEFEMQQEGSGVWEAMNRQEGVEPDRAVTYTTRKKAKKTHSKSELNPDEKICRSLVKDGEKVTEREQKGRILHALRNFESPSLAGAGGNQSIGIDREQLTCNLSGTAWDTCIFKRDSRLSRSNSIHGTSRAV